MEILNSINHWSLSLIGGFVICGSICFFILEIFLRISLWIKRTFIYKEVRRQDYLAPQYQDYIKKAEDWTKPTFEYIPIGLRVYNTKNPLPGRVTNNSLGFRCREFTPPQSDELRIVLLGGSAAWGSGASTNDETIAGYLEAIINTDKALLGPYKRASCFNLAQLNGYQTQDLLHILLFFPKLKPHYVISFSGWNELLANNIMKKKYLEGYGVFYIDEMDGWEPIKCGNNKQKIMRDSFTLWAREKSAIAQTFLKPRIPNQEVRGLNESVRIGTKLFLNNLENIDALSKAYNYEHFQFLQPSLYGKNHLNSDEKAIIHLYDIIRPVYGGNETGEFLRNNNVYKGILDHTLKHPENHTSITDLSGLFRESKDNIFYTLVHMTDLGYRLVADKMYQTLLSSKLANRERQVS